MAQRTGENTNPLRSQIGRKDRHQSRSPIPLVKRGSRIADQDEMGAIIAEIQGIPLLLRHEEQALAQRIQNGDQEAVDILVSRNRRLVLAIARSIYLGGTYSDSSLTFGDIFQAGCLGLVRAARRFKPGRGKFSTYATYWIRQKILRVFADCGTIHLPVHIHAEIKAARKACAQRNLAFNPENIALVVGKNDKNGYKRACLLFESAGIFSGVNSLDEPIGRDPSAVFDRPHLLLETIPDETAPEPLQEVTSTVLSEMIEAVLEKIKPHEREWIKAYYCHNQSLREIADGTAKGLTGERVRQVIEAGLEKIRNLMRIYGHGLER